MGARSVPRRNQQKIGRSNLGEGRKPHKGVVADRSPTKGSASLSLQLQSISHSQGSPDPRESATRRMGGGEVRR